MKTCAQCKMTKPDNMFYISKDKKSGSLPVCIKCVYLNTKYFDYLINKKINESRSKGDFE
jgi:hypothetical protein